MLMPICSAAVIVLNASYDGGVATGDDANWTEIRSAPGDSHDNLATKVYSGMTVGNVSEPHFYDEHWRGLVTWDTQDIPDDATITSATISVYGAGKMPELGVVNFCVIDAFPANQLAFADRDYQRTTFTRYATDMPYESYNKNTGWNSISLNSLGLNNISKTGYTTFMFTHSADVDNTNLTWVGGLDGDGEPQASGFQFQGVNNTYKPYITIYYESSAPLPVLTVSASPIIVTAGTPTNVKFLVRNATSTLPVNGATVTLTGVATGSGSTGADGNATISVNANSAGIITATASMTGYTSNTTTVTANPAPIMIPDKIGIYKSGTWYLDGSGNGAWDAGDLVSSFGGSPGFTAVTGDWNATGNSYIGVTNGQQWYLDWNGNGIFDSGVDKCYNFGAPGWKNVTGDWNGDGKTDIGVTNGQQWYLDWNGNGFWDVSDKAYSFGAPGWTPVVGDWNATGNSYIGVTNGQQWYLDWNGNGVWDGSDKAYSFGAPG